jgi:hypothetical protein
MLPEDYAALYLQFATGAASRGSGLKLGGPVFEASTTTSWSGRMPGEDVSGSGGSFDYLRAHGRLAD